MQFQMQRYYLQFSYFGKHFRGLQKQFYRPADLHLQTEEKIRENYQKDEITVQVV